MTAWKRWTPDEIADLQRLYDEEHLTLQQIGERADVNLSRERVRQLINTTPEAQERRREARAAAKLERLRERFRELRDSGLSLAEIREELETHWNVIADLNQETPLESRALMAERQLKKASARKTSEAVLLERLRLAATEVGGPLGPAAFDEIARREGWNKWQTYRLRFGSFAAACKKAGVAPRTRTWRAGWASVSVEKAEADLAFAVKTLGHFPTYFEYEAVARERRLTCGTTVRRLLGPWSGLMRRELDRSRSEQVELETL